MPLTIEQQNKIEKLQEARVIIRIWTSKANVDYRGKNCGHVSLEIAKVHHDSSNLYVSWWPVQPVHNHYEQVHGILHTLDLDMLAEGEKGWERSPEIMYCFYTLNTRAIYNEFMRMCNRIDDGSLKWCMFGNIRNWLIPKSSEAVIADNCSTLIYQLLEAGDKQQGDSKMQILDAMPKQASTTSAAASFRLFASPRHSSNIIGASLIKNPDALVTLLAEAKQKELMLEPLTAEIHYPNETIPKNIIKSNHDTCIIL